MFVQCTDYMCWRQFKNRGAFLPWIPREGLLGHFCAADHVSPTIPSHFWAPLLAHGTKGGRAEREEEGGGYYTEEGEYIGEEGGED